MMKKLFAELARRQVFRVAAAYAIVGWLALQATGLIAPGLGLPEWTFALVFFLLVIGFPFAVLLAWAFELTPEGVRRTEATDAPDPSIKLVDAGFLGVLVLVLLVSSVGVFRPVGPADKSPEQREVVNLDSPSRQAIAVLPFADMSPEGDQDWFSDGISEEIIHRLALEKNLTVAGRTSSFYFKGKNVAFEEIGRMLNVGTVLEGSVRKDGTRVRITAQLIDIATGAHRWSGTFDRELKDIFRIQEDLSVSIARELLRELGVEPSVPETTPYEPNLEAYQAHLRAAQIYNSSFTPEAMQESARLERKAADLDKGYIEPLSILLLRLAYADKSWIGPHNEDLYGSSAIIADVLARNPPPREVLFVKASAAVFDWRFVEAEQLYREYAGPTAGMGFSLAALLAWTGRFQEAIPALEQGLKNAPLSGLQFLVLSNAYSSAGRYEDVFDLTDRAIELGLPFIRILLDVRANAAISLQDKTIYEETKALAGKILGVNTDDLTWQVWDARLASDLDALDAIRRELVRRYDETGDSNLTARIASLYARLGEDEAALQWYRKAVEARSREFRRQMRSPKELPALFSTPEGHALIREAGYDAAWFKDLRLAEDAE